MDTGMSGHPRGGAGRALAPTRAQPRPGAALALAVALAVLPFAGTVAEGAGNAAVTKTSAAQARKEMAVAEARLQRSRERLENLSKALQAAVGDQPEYARLRAMHDREVDEYDAASLALQAMPSPY